MVEDQGIDPNPETRAYLQRKEAEGKTRMEAAVDGARETLATFFHCREAEVVFNSGGTEGDNTAIFPGTVPMN